MWFSSAFFLRRRLTAALWATATAAAAFTSRPFLASYPALSATRSLCHPTKPFASSYSTTPCARLQMATSETETVDVAFNLQEVQEAIRCVCQDVGRSPEQVRLVAVSKTKPLELLQQAYHCGQRVFGENYAQELVDKAEQMGHDHDDIVWHFIGGLQSNKANMLVKGVVPHGNLVVETVGSIKVATKLNNAMANLDDELPDEKKGTTLSVFVQINTSGEDAKSGVSPGDEAIELCQHIIKSCDRLHLMGLMTIGAIGDISNFETLVACRDTVANALSVDPSTLELSMGMSGDYKEAIRYGATNVRVGSTLFGARDYSNKN